MKDKAIDHFNEATGREYKVIVVGEFRFTDDHEASRFRARFLEYLTHEKNVYILEPNLEVTMTTKEYRQSFGNLIEIPIKKTTMRV